MEEQTYPIMRRPNDTTPATPLRVPWSVAEKAYSVYSARYGRSQTLERLSERGGFWVDEMDEYHPSWREETSEIASLRAQLADAERLRADPFDKIGTDRLADEVAVLVRLGKLDPRSPAGDALLDYRAPPSSPRADRLATLEIERADEAQRYAFHVDEALAERDALVARVTAMEVAIAPLRAMTTTDMVPVDGRHASLRNYVRHWLLPALDALASPAEPKGEAI